MLHIIPLGVDYLLGFSKILCVLLILENILDWPDWQAQHPWRQNWQESAGSHTDEGATNQIKS